MVNHPNRSKNTAGKPVLTMTLGDIRSKGPCQEGWLKLIRSVGDNPKTVVSLGDIAMSNDFADAAWCFRCLDWSDIAVRRAAISGAVLPAVKRASQHTKDARVFEAIAIIEKWCAGDDTVDLKKATDAATAAAYAANAAANAANAANAAAYVANAAYAANAANAADANAAAYAAANAANAADAASKAEREQQRQDIIAAFPPAGIGDQGCVRT